MINAVKRFVPSALKRKIKAYLAERRKARLFGPLAPLVPDADDMFDGPQSIDVFKANGEEFLKIYKEICGLRRTERMLDVGCGIGRKTLPLTQYLTRDARYEGFDITRAGIEWCASKITPRFPNFQFQTIEVYNKHYNPQGTCPPSQYRFPCEDGTFSFVVLGSVFTHMLPDGLSNYLSEIHRVLEKGGRCLITYFLLNPESLPLIEAGKSSLDFKFIENGYRLVCKAVPEQAIAFDEDLIMRLYRKVGLDVTRVDYGSWCGRRQYLSYQDLVLAVKA
jgi:SAM-dependent methyltransferase